MTISLEAVPDGAAFLFPEGEFTLEAIEEWGKAQERHLARVDNPAAVPFLYVDADPPVFEPVQSEDAAWYCAEIARDPARLASEEDLRALKNEDGWYSFRPEPYIPYPASMCPPEFLPKYTFPFVIGDLVEADEEPIAEATVARRNLVGVMFVPASQVKARTQRWLWDGRIPLALPTLLVGMQGLGKSQLTCWLTARVTTGEIGSGPGSVLVLSAEDDPETTIVPRLMAAGADLERVRLHKIDRSLTFPKDIALLDEAVQMYGATFVVVDPIMAYLDADTDAYRPQDVRRTLRGINAVCQEQQATVLPLMHFRKESANEVLHMVTSSSAFTEGPRSVLGLGKQPEAGEGQLALVHLKCNVGPMQPTLSVTVEPTLVLGSQGEEIPTSYIKIGEELDLSARDVFQPKQGRPAEARSEAVDFLKKLLAKHNGRIPAAIGLSEWKASGLGSPDTLKRARKDMGLSAVQDETGTWYWVEEF